MKNSTDQFKKTISAKLEEIAANDEQFAAKFSNEKKNIDDCIKYILNTVQKSGCNGFTDDEVYGMAIHYYDEENVEAGGDIQARVVVNHTIELSEEEKKEARQKAIDGLIEDEKVRLMAKKKLKDLQNKKNEVVQSSLF